MAGSIRSTGGANQLRRSNSSPNLGQGNETKNLSDVEKKKAAKKQAKLDAEIKKQAKKDEAGPSGTAETAESPTGSKTGKGFFSKSSSGSDLSSFNGDKYDIVMPESLPDSPLHPMMTGKAPMISQSSSESSLVQYSKPNSEHSHTDSGSMTPSDSSSQYSPLNLTMENFDKFRRMMAGGHWSPGKIVWEAGDKNTIHPRWIGPKFKPYQESPAHPLRSQSFGGMSEYSWSNFPFDPREMGLLPPKAPAMTRASSEQSISSALSEYIHIPGMETPAHSIPGSPATHPGQFGAWNETIPGSPATHHGESGAGNENIPPRLANRPGPIEIPPREFPARPEPEIVSLYSSSNPTPLVSLPHTPTEPGWLAKNQDFFKTDEGKKFLVDNPDFFKQRPAWIATNPWVIEKYPEFYDQFPESFTRPAVVAPEKKSALSGKAALGLAAVTGVAAGAAVTGALLGGGNDSADGSVQTA